MSAPAFTPAPWHALDIGEIVPSDDEGFPLDETRICFMATPGEGGGAAQDRIDANARLIAAAPSMYEALNEIAKGAGPFNRDPLIHAENTIESMKEIALAALAKARGEQQ
jgi:hypothetical protein